MTRRECLKAMLKSIFDFVSFSIDDGKIQKSGNNSMYHNCNYTVSSYRDFTRFFEIAFISEKPKYSDDTDFDRVEVVGRAKKYLSDYGIKFPDCLTDCEQRQQIFEIFSQHLLKTVLIDFDSKDRSASADDNITNEFLSCLQQIRDKINLQYTASTLESVWAYNGYTPFTDIEFKSDPDKCNFNIECDMCYMKAYSVLHYLRKVQLVIPTNKASNPPGNMRFDTLPHYILSGFFNSKKQSLQTYNFFSAAFFSDQNELYSKTHYIFKTFISEDDIIKNSKGLSLGRVVANYTNEFFKEKIQQQLEPKTINELKTFYENNRTYLERMISGILTYNKKNKELLEEYKNTGDNRTAKELLYDKCYQLFWNFEMPYLAIEQAYPDNVDRGMYILLQNYIFDLTEILNSHGQEIAEQFKQNLSDKSFKAHKDSIKRYFEAKDKRFITAIEFESVYAEKNKSYVKELQTVDDFFQCIRTDTYSSFKSALYNYHSLLLKVNKNNS